MTKGKSIVYLTWFFNCEETNDWCLIELFVIHGNVWNHSTFLTYVKLNF